MPTPDRDESKPGRRWPFYVVLFVLFLPMLYVLSIGPAVWLLANGHVSREPLRTLYAPLEWLGDAAPSSRRPLQWYVRLWAAPIPPE